MNTKSNTFGWLLKITGAVTIVTASFFATLFVLDMTQDLKDPGSRDLVRTENAKVIMRALAEYRSAKGAYPVLPVPDSHLTELTKLLVATGYLRKVPVDPPGREPTHYVSFDGKAFGLWIHFEQSPPCIVEVGASKTGWWNQPPPCKI